MRFFRCAQASVAGDESFVAIAWHTLAPPCVGPVERFEPAHGPGCGVIRSTVSW